MEKDDDGSVLLARLSVKDLQIAYFSVVIRNHLTILFTDNDLSDALQGSICTDYRLHRRR
jgi:hypothetical protein